mgnify:FL=1
MNNSIGFRRLFSALRNSIVGLKDAMIHHPAFRQEVVIVAVLIPFAIWLGENGLERAILIGVLLIVLIVELINSAIETVVDRISTEKHKLSKQAKDLASAAVLIALLSVLLVWGLILF